MNQLFDSIVNDPAVGAIGLALAGAATGLWLAAAWWTYIDVSRRTTMEVARLLAVAWILLSTPALLPLSLGIYLLARPHLTVAERRAQRLFEALEPALDSGSCPACGVPVTAGWQRCPACASWLAAACPTCGETLALGLEICPWCASDTSEAPTRLDFPAAAVADAAASSASGRRVGALARPAAAFAANRAASAQAGNRGARDLRRTRGADRVAGSSRLGIGS